MKKAGAPIPQTDAPAVGHLTVQSVHCPVEHCPSAYSPSFFSAGGGRTIYSTAQHDYYCYVLEEVVSLGNLDLSRLLADRRREQGASFKLGAPIYLKGGELISYRN